MPIFGHIIQTYHVCIATGFFHSVPSLNVFRRILLFSHLAWDISYIAISILPTDHTEYIQYSQQSNGRMIFHFVTSRIWTIIIQMQWKNDSSKRKTIETCIIAAKWTERFNHCTHQHRFLHLHFDYFAIAYAYCLAAIFVDVSVYSFFRVQKALLCFYGCFLIMCFFISCIQCFGRQCDVCTVPNKIT